MIFRADYVIMVSCVILVGLFSIQHHGTHRVAFLFAPVVAIWLLCISSIGIYNIFHWNPKIYRALCPIYMVKFIKTIGIEAWLSLGGVVLSITGTYYICLSYFISSQLEFWKWFFSEYSQVWRPCLLTWAIFLLSL